MTDSKVLNNKIDFAVIISVNRANPNGDPLNGNRPRQTYDGHGEISDVCLKRKIRNRLQDMGESIFVQSDDNRAPGDEFRSLNDRFKAALDRWKKEVEDNEIESVDERNNAPKEWFDVRAFGQVFAFKGNKDEDSDAVSIGIRGPVTIQSAFSIEPITPDSLQITKSVNLETEKNPDKKGADTMGMKHRVDKGIYVTYGAINTQLAGKTGFSDDDAGKIKLALQTLFVNDVSSARPEGSMEVLKVIWWQHNSPSGQYSSSRVHRALRELLDVNKDGTYDSDKLKESLKGLEPEELYPLEGEALQKLYK